MCMNAGPKICINRIHTGGLYLDKNLIALRLWSRDIFELHHLGVAEFVNNYGFHIWNAGILPAATFELSKYRFTKTAGNLPAFRYSTVTDFARFLG